ncbi:MAG: NAD-dependent epimerase/dehydratase family protein, partial [Hypericibacter sp.]
KVVLHSDSPQGRRVLVTGLDGFTGRYVARELESAGYTVVGLHAAGGGKVDLNDALAVRGAVEAVRADAVIHLAAIASVVHDDVRDIYTTNVIGTRNLLAALAGAEVKPRIVVVASSANVYGNAALLPITEATPPAPTNDYAVSKLAVEHIARIWGKRLPIVIVRPFNYTGVGQSEYFLLPKIVNHFRRGDKVIRLGNIDVVRDFSDVRTIAYAYRRLMELSPAGETINFCSGVGTSLISVLDIMAKLAGYEIQVESVPLHSRENEIKALYGSPTKLSELVVDYRQPDISEILEWMYKAPPLVS